MVVVAAAKPHVAAIVRRHNAILRAAHARIDGSLEEKLAALIQPILEKAGNQAAARFQKLATNHLTAALHERADQQALQRIAPGLAEDGFFGYRLRPFALTASAPTPNSAMICVKPRPDEAAEIAWPDGETAESLHVTLVYLGPVDGSLQEIADALAPVAASHAPLEGVVGGVGKFQPPGVAILLPDVPGLVELRVAVTEALVEKGIFYSRDHGFEAHVSIDAAPDPDTLEEALARTAQKPLHFDSILIVRGDSEVVEVPLIGPSPVTASGLVAAGEHVGWTGPAGDELIDVDKLVASLRTKTDPVRMAVLKSSMDPALEAAGISFDVSNPLTAKVLSQAGSQVKGIAETTQLNVMRIIDRSYNQGLSIPDTAKAIKAGMASASGYRARTIARTELAGAANGGSLAATMLAAGALGIGFYKQWLTAPGAPHPRHEDYEGLDGQTVGLEDAFDVGGENLQFPGDPDGSPEETINCFPGSTLVVAPGARVGFRRRYEGDLVRLEAQGVGDLSGTPNHPILTSAGWKPLGLLREGDYLVCAISRQGEGAVDPDVDHAPASIHQVFGALAAGKVSRRVRGLPVQFHGDLSADGEVEVVAADCDLGSGDDTALREQGGEFQFARAGLAECPLARASLGLDLALGGRSAAPGDVGGGGQLSAISGAGLTHPHAHRLGTGARRQTDVAECSVDDPTSDPVALGESLYGSSCEILLAQVVRVERSAFAGDVYNLQTDSGTYVANGIITHNCRCALAYTETPPEGAAATAEPEGGLTDEGVSQSGTTALDEAMPLTAPAGDTVSVNSTPFVPSPVVDRIKALGLDKPLKDVRPTTDIGREVYARGPTTEDLFKQGGEWTPERQQIHADIVAKHFEGKTPPVAGSPKTAIFTSGGGARARAAR